jgi:putative transposase
MTIDNELIDNLLKDYKKPEDLVGENGLFKQLTKQLHSSRRQTASLVRATCTLSFG